MHDLMLLLFAKNGLMRLFSIEKKKIKTKNKTYSKKTFERNMKAG